MADNYEQVADNNPLLLTYVINKIEQVVEEKGLTSEAAEKLRQAKYQLTAALASTCVSEISQIALETGLGPQSKVARFLVGASVDILTGEANAIDNILIEGDMELEQLGEALVSSVASSIVQSGIAEMGFSIGSRFVLFLGVGYSIAKLVHAGYENWMDGKAIAEAMDDGSHFIKCESSLSDFLSERWEQVTEEEGMLKWSLQEDNKPESLLLAFNAGDGTDLAILTIQQSNRTSLTGFYDNGNREAKKISAVLLEKIGTDFNATFDNGTTVRKIKNYYIGDSADATAFAQDVIDMNGEEKKKALHALKHLRPFIEEGVAAYDEIDPDEYSEQYIKDRAQFLYAYTREKMGMTVHPGIYFKDDGVNPNFTAGLQAGQIQYYWGRNGNGSQYSDHLFGTGENDTLVGNDGEDYIEGGKGRDTLKGGLKKDTFFIMGKDTDYDVFNGGHGEDTIKGSEKNDAIRVHNFEGENTVEKIDGGGGEYDTLEGTSDRDVIDLSATSLEKIHEIALYNKMPGMGLADYSDDLYLNDQSYDSTLEKIDGGKGADDTIIGKSREGAEDDDIILGLEGLEISGIETIQTGAGSDQINLLNATIDGDSLSIEAGDGDNTLDLEGVQASGTELTALRTGKDNDTVNLKNGAFQRINIIDADDGDNSIDLTGVQTSQVETITGGVNKDDLTYHGNMLVSVGSIELGDGENTIDFQGAQNFTITSIKGGNDKDYFKIVGSAGVSIGTIDIGSGANYLIFEGSQQLSIGTITAGDDNGYLPDIYNFKNTHISSIDTINLGKSINKLDFTNAIIDSIGPLNGNSGSDTFRFNNATLSGDLTVDGGDGGNYYDFSGATGGTITVNGGDEVDKFIGSDGKDIVHGGGGKDEIRGNGGTDTLEGGDGYDTYFADDGDTIKDSDHEGRAHFGGTVLSYGYKKEGEDYYKGNGGKYTLSGGTLTFKKGGKTLTVKNYSKDQESLGIILEEEEPDDPPPPTLEEPPPPQTGGDPLILDLGGDGIITTGLDADIHFDHNGDGFRELSGFVNPDDGLLVLDRNEDGQINDGTELFGDSTRLIDGSIAQHGFAALTEFDDQKDGVIDKNDAIFSKLRIFQDYNQNGKVDAGELFSLEEKKIAGLNLTYEDSSFVDEFGNIHRQLGTYVTESGEVRTMTDVVFALDMARTTTEMLDVPPEIAALPDAVGYGTTYSLHQAMVRDESGRLQELVEQYAASEVRAERQALVEDILYVWTGQEEGQGPGFEKQINVLDSFFGQTLGGAWLRATNRFDQLKDMVTKQLSRQTHLVEVFDSISYEYNQDADTWVGQYGNAVHVLTGMLESGSHNNHELVQEVVQCIRGINPYNRLNLDAFAAAVNTYLEDPVVNDVNSSETLGLLTSLGAGASDLDDVMHGGERSGLLYGFGGDDTIFAEGGDDIIVAGTGDDAITGGSGNDIYRFAKGFGKDRINNYDTDAGRIDSIEFTDGTTAADLEFARQGDDLIISFADSEDQIRVNSHFYLDSTGGYAVNLIRFADGSTLDIGSSGFEVLNEIVNEISEEDDTLHGTLNADTINGLGGNDKIFGKGGNDSLYGSAGNDSLYGEGGDDTLAGGAGNDELTGGTGNDQLFGGAGDDTLRGNDGDNLLVGGLGNDYLVGGEGVDVFRYALGDGRDVITNREKDGSVTDVLELTGGITETDVEIRRVYNNLLLRLADGGEVWVENFFLYETPSFSEIRFDDGTVWDQGKISLMVRQGTDQNDYLYGTGQGDVLHGLEGNDRIEGYSGDDQIHGDQGSDKLYGNKGNDTILGGSGNDQLYGDGGDDVLTGGAGVDVIHGGSGHDTYLYESGFGQDVIYNKAESTGIDAIVFGSSILKEQVVAERRANNLVLRVEGTDDSITVGNYFLGIDNITSNVVDEIRFADGTIWDVAAIKQLTVRETAGDDVIHGYAEDNVFDGLAGDDEIHGGDGNDHLTGNTGGDYLHGDSGNDTLIGNSGDDVLYGGRGDDVLDGGEGDDILSGYYGNDTFLFNAGFGKDKLIKNYFRNGETGTIKFGAGITASQFTVSRKGRRLYLQSTTSEDSLSIDDFFNAGGARAAGTPYVFEFADGSTLDFDYLVDQSLQATSEGSDYLFGYEEDNTLNGAGGNDTLIGNDGLDTLTGGAGDDRLEGGAGNDNLDGGSGHDTIYGGDGSDTIVGDSGNDKIYGGSGDDHITGAEGNDYIDGGNDVDTILAGAGNDKIRGGRGADILTAGTGNDRLYGDRGDDILTGGEGDDYLTGGLGNDVYQYSSGFGKDTIDNYYNANNDAFDIIRFDETITPGDVKVLRNGNNLNLVVAGTGDRITVNNYFHSHARGNYIVNEIQFADGTVWDIPTVKELVLTATSEADELHGYETDDAIEALAGADTVFGYEGADTLSGGAGNDVLDGGSGNDFLMGGEGDDILKGSAGDDTLAGGLGNDTLSGGSGNDVYSFGLGDGQDIINNNDSSDSVDILELREGIAQEDVRIRRVGNDMVVFVGAGDDKVTVKNCFYNEGNSNYAIGGLRLAGGATWSLAELKALSALGSEQDDRLVGFTTSDEMTGFGGDDELFGAGGDDSLSGGAGSDVLHAGTGNDLLHGDSGDDTVYGDSGINTLYGDSGNDMVIGGSGDDILVGGAGNDDLSGGLGNDIYRFSLGDGQDTITNYDSSATRLDVVEFQAGIAANDIQVKRDGNDLLLLVKGTAEGITVKEYFQAEGYSRYRLEEVRFADGTSWDIEKVKELAVLGTTEGDLLVGFSDEEIMKGFGGDDSLSGLGGDDILQGGTGNDILDGGSGNDTYTFSLGDGQDVINNHDTAANRLDKLEFQDGIAEGDVRAQRVGNDLYLHVGSGGDQVVVDRYFEGEGYGKYALDEVRFSDGTSWDIDRVKELAMLGTASADLLNGFAAGDVIKGFAGDDTIDGAKGDDAIYGGKGNDTLQGGLGSDTYHFSLGDGQDTIDNYDSSSQSHDTILFDESIDVDDVLVKRSGDNLHLVIGGGSDRIVVSNFFESEGLGRYGLDEVRFASGTSWDIDQLKKFAVLGTPDDELLLGYSTDDVMKGFGGDDTMKGLGGNDAIHGGDGADEIEGGSGEDTILGESGNDTLRGNDDDDTITSGAGDDTVFGGTGDDIITGGTGIDTLNGGFGNDNIQGGDDGDIIRGDSGNDTLFGNDGNDQIYGGFHNDTIYGGEGLDTLRGDDGNDTVYGGDGEDSIMGNSGSDTLYGDAGNDNLAGNAGNDRLDGGIGADTMRGGIGGDTYVVDDINDEVIELADEGYDSIETNLDVTLMENVEKGVLTGTADIDATGNGLNNLLIGNGGDNILDGATGMDEMVGGAGNDIYHTDVQGDTITEGISAGIDTEIRSHESSYLLSANVENLTLTGTVFRGNGNALDNVLTGNDAENNLWGREGNDTIYGMGGDDQLIGDAGQDHLEGGAGNDLMSGGGADDTLLGGAGNDQLDGGAGTNYLRGGAGDDKYVYRADGGKYEIDNSDGGADWLLFTDELTADKLSFIKSGDDLIVRVEGDENRQVTITSWFLGTQYQLHAIQPSGANGITAETINRMFPPADAEADTIEVPADSTFDARRYGTSADEQLLGTGGSDVIRGYQGADNIFAQAGEDWVLGGSGNDFLDGGTGNDMLHGGAGNDRYVFRPGYGEETIDNTGGGVDWLLFADGLSQEKLIFSQVGDDLVISIKESTDKVTVKDWFLGPDYQIDYIQPDGGSGIPAAQIDNLLGSDPGSDFDTIVDGTDGDEQLVGTSGTDQINGLEGADQLFGLGENDELNGGAGNDYLDGGAGDDIQNGGAGNDQLGGDAGNDTLVGGAGDDTYVYKPGSGIDTIDNAGGGVDSLIFTNDINSDRLTYLKDGDNLIVRVDESESSQVTVVDWFKGGEYQLSYIQPAGQNGIPASQINDLFTTNPPAGDDLEVPDEGTFDAVRTGTEAGEQVIGTNGKDLLKGLGGGDQLFAFGGDDWLLGGDGNDYFDGGAGNDTMLGGAGNDQLGGDAGNDIMSAGAGDDKYVYRPGSGADTIINSGGGTDWLLFTDDITSDRLSYFQSGDDLLVKIDGSNDNMVTIKDWFLGGEHQVSYIQPAGAYGIPAAQINTMVQQEPAPAAASMAVSGNSSLSETATEDTFSSLEKIYGTNHNDILRGDSESNAIIGQNGNEELYGGLGSDYLEGGEGNDTFVFNTALDGEQNLDSIADFESGKDTLKLHSSIFDALQAEGILSEANFHASKTGLAVDDNDYILYNTTTGVLSYDFDGNGQGVAVEFAKLTSKPELQNKDILIAA